LTHLTQASSILTPKDVRRDMVVGEGDGREVGDSCVKVRQGDLNASVDKELRLDAGQHACVKVRQGCDEAASREGTGGFWTTEPLGKMLKFKLRPEWLETLTLKQRQALIPFTWDDGLPIDPGEEEKYEAYAMRLLSRA